MIKTLCLLMMMVTMGLLTGCNHQNNLVLSQFKLVEDPAMLQITAPLDVLPALNRQGIGDVVLSNLLNNERLAEFSVQPDEMILTTQTLTTGDYGILAVSGMEEEGGFFWMSPEMDLTATLLLFNQNLELSEEIVLTDEAIATHNATIFYHEGAIKIYYAINHHLYAYDVFAGVTTQVVALEENFNFEQIAIATHNQVVFVAGKLGNETQLYYGSVCLNTQEITLLETDFPIADMVIGGNHLLLTENIPPRQEPRGEVIVFNLVTKEAHTVQLENYESMVATVIADRYVLTGSYQHIRIYEITTNAIVLDASPAVTLTRVHDEEVPPHIHDFLTLNENLYAIVFNDGSDVFHVEFIELEELE